jgi:hypothetical protein
MKNERERLNSERQELIIKRAEAQAMVSRLTNRIVEINQMMVGQLSFSEHYGRTNSPIDYTPRAPRMPEIVKERVNRAIESAQAFGLKSNGLPRR